MKTMNNFQISGFVVNNATINQFATASSPHGEDRWHREKGFRNPQHRGMEEQRGF